MSEKQILVYPRNFYRTLSYGVHVLPSDADGVVWLNEDECFDWGTADDKVIFYDFGSSVLGCSLRSGVGVDEVFRALGDNRTCEGLSRIEARICPVRHSEMPECSESELRDCTKLCLGRQEFQDREYMQHHNECRGLVGDAHDRV